MGLEAMGPDRSLLLPSEPRGGLVLLSPGNVESPSIRFLTSRQRMQRSLLPIPELKALQRAKEIVRFAHKIHQTTI